MNQKDLNLAAAKEGGGRLQQQCRDGTLPHTPCVLRYFVAFNLFRVWLNVVGFQVVFFGSWCELCFGATLHYSAFCVSLPVPSSCSLFLCLFLLPFIFRLCLEFLLFLLLFLLLVLLLFLFLFVSFCSSSCSSSSASSINHQPLPLPLTPAGARLSGVSL